jgi:hypothetical protein
MVKMWKLKPVVAKRFGVPDALVTVTVEFPWVKVPDPPPVKRLPLVPVKVMTEAAEVQSRVPVDAIEMALAVRL